MELYKVLGSLPPLFCITACWFDMFPPGPFSHSLDGDSIELGIFLSFYCKYDALESQTHYSSFHFFSIQYYVLAISLPEHIQQSRSA